MADQKISQLTGGGAAQATDEYVVARAGGNNKITGANVAAAATSVGTLSSLTVSGDLTVDTSTLKVDSANNRVGIGMTDPATALNIGMANAATTSLIGRYNTSGASATGTFRVGAGEFTIAQQVRSYIDFVQSYNGSSNDYDIQFTTTKGGVGGGVRAIIDASGNLGLGVTPSASNACNNFQIGPNGDTLSSRISVPQLAISSNAVGNWYAATYKVNGYATQYTQQGNDGTHAWFTAASGTAGNAITFTQAMTLDASGGLKTLNTIGVGNTNPAASGAGITFPATQSASSDANTLDDYEEGNWTPVIKFGATSATLTDTSARYTKIGNTVMCWLETYTTNLNSGTGDFELSGLPFTNGSMRSAQGDFFFQFMSATFPAGDKMAFVESSASALKVRYFTGSSGTAVELTDTHFTTSSYVYAQIVYRV